MSPVVGVAIEKVTDAEFLIIGTMVRIPAESAGIRRMMADDGINTSVTKLLMTSYYLSTCPA